VFKGDPGNGSKHTILRWSGKWCFGCFAFGVFQKGVEHRLGTIFQEPPTAYESR